MENRNGLFYIKWENQKLKHFKRMDHLNCQIPDFVQAISDVEIVDKNWFYR